MSKVFRVTWVKVINNKGGIRRVPSRIAKVKKASPRVKNTSLTNRQWFKRGTSRAGKN